jgi:hypothetical protein
MADPTTVGMIEGVRGSGRAINVGRFVGTVEHNGTKLEVTGTAGSGHGFTQVGFVRMQVELHI